MRKKIELPKPKDESLDALINLFAENKAIFDEYKKITDEQNANIKRTMEQLNYDEYDTGSFTARKSIQIRETLNEEALLKVVKAFNIPGIIKIKEYVDVDELENYLYNNDIQNDLLYELDKCREKKSVVVLKVSKTKKEK